MTSASPVERSPTRYFARRPSAASRAPVRRWAKFGGKGKRRSARRVSARRILRPSIAGARPRRTVSTSGSSGIGLAYSSGDALRLWSDHNGRRQGLLRVRGCESGRKIPPRQRRIRVCRVEIRPDERPDVGRRPPRLESQPDRQAEPPAGRDADRCGGRHGRCGAGLSPAGERGRETPQHDAHDALAIVADINEAMLVAGRKAWRRPHAARRLRRGASAVSGSLLRCADDFVRHPQCGGDRCGAARIPPRAETRRTVCLP